MLMYLKSEYACFWIPNGPHNPPTWRGKVHRSGHLKNSAAHSNWAHWAHWAHWTHWAHWAHLENLEYLDFFNFEYLENFENFEYLENLEYFENFEYLENIEYFENLESWKNFEILGQFVCRFLVSIWHRFFADLGKVLGPCWLPKLIRIQC